MVPKILEIMNFLSYGEKLQTINFSSFDLICLSGKNGHGKSALLDAITWALWGQARKASGVTKPDDGLINLGKSKMMVSLEFESQGSIYRVRREYFKSYGRPISALDFEEYDKNDEKFVAITGKTIRATQEKIESTIGLDFDTFTNSSFLRQGVSDEFTNKTPRERKQVLSRVMGLEKYDKFQQKASEFSRIIGSEIKSYEALKLRINEDIKNKPSLEERLREENIRLSELNAQDETIKKELGGLILKEKETHGFRDKKLKLERSILEAEKGLLEREIEISKNSLKEEAALRELLEKARIRQARVSYDLNSTNEAIAQINKKLREIKNKLEQQPVIIKKGENLKNDIDKIYAQFEKRRSYYQVLVHRGNWIRDSLKELLKKENVLGDVKDPVCPTCDQEITNERLERLCSDVGHKKRLFEHRLNRVKKIINNLKIVLIDQKTELDQILKEQKSVELFLGNMRELENELKILDNEFSILEKKSKELSGSEAIEKENCIKSENEIKKKSEEAKQLLGNDEKLKKIRSEIKGLTEERDSICTNLGPDALRLEKTIEVARIRIEEVSKRREAVLGVSSRLSGEIERLGGLSCEIGRLEKTIDGFESEISEFTTLAQAFGKNGLQALLIEDAIPELEDAANEILAKLSDGSVQIFIESLRDLKKGGSRESLDIKISDERGIRPYEMFSGGEAFRIDFAIRIAMSKFLARRAGASLSLQTLIIDEGFGSQDEEGLSRLMESIYAIRQDFSKIIVVSHLPALKEQFPVHFLVEKGPFGSTVEVEERG
jgi:DNA repair protein SbcC/Rad50